MSHMKTEIQYEDLVSAVAPLLDASRALDRIKENVGTNEIMEFLDYKVKNALKPLESCIEKIEPENPDKFS